MPLSSFTGLRCYKTIWAVSRKQLSVDAGYFSEGSIALLHQGDREAVIPPDRSRYTEQPLSPSQGRISKNLCERSYKKGTYNKEKKGGTSMVRERKLLNPSSDRLREE